MQNKNYIFSDTLMSIIVLDKIFVSEIKNNVYKIPVLDRNNISIT